MVLYLHGIHESYTVGRTHSTLSPNAQHPTPYAKGLHRLCCRRTGPRRYVFRYVYLLSLLVVSAVTAAFLGLAGSSF